MGSAMSMALALLRKPNVSLKNTGSGEAGRATKLSGSCVTILPPPARTMRPARVTVAMPITMAPGTRGGTRIAVSTMPPRQRATGPEAKLPWVTKVAGLATITPPFLRPMKAMKRPMPQVIAIFSACGIACDDLLADAGDGEEKEDDAAVEDDAEGGLPGDLRAETDPEGEERVNSHAGRQRDRIIGKQRHQGGRQGGRHRRDRHQGGFVHPGVGEDGGIHGQNVGHGREGGEAGLHLTANRRVVFL